LEEQKHGKSLPDAGLLKLAFFPGTLFKSSYSSLTDNVLKSSVELSIGNWKSGTYRMI
jgi:hypothetical protein